MKHSRRKFIQMTGIGMASLSFPGWAKFSSVQSTKQVHNQPKIVWVMLRGALDSLHTIIPSNDSHYKTLRPKLANSFKQPLLPLNQQFALHPSLINLHQWYKEQTLIPVVAVSSGYQRRSHFDGQDYLESGLGEINHDSGWLARAINIKQKRGVAISQITPISLRSAKKVYSWFPSKLKSADNEIYDSLSDLYQHDEHLSKSLTEGLTLKGIIGEQNISSKRKQGKFVELSKSCAKLMHTENGPDCAMLEIGGWDTHNNQANRLNRKLSELDQGLAQLKSGLADAWQNTVVIIGTEFGRTARENGTAGTDHGTGSALFLTGGAIKGGVVKGRWPGLTNGQLLKERDLMPTTNSFSWIANVLQQHWHFSDQEIQEVFPHVKAYTLPLV